MLQLEMFSSCQFEQGKDSLHRCSDRPQHEIDMWVSAETAGGTFILYSKSTSVQKTQIALLLECTFHIHVTFF